MSLLGVLVLSGVVSVWSQSTLEDSQCDGDCRNDVEIHTLVAMKKNMERDLVFLKDANERSQKKIMKLETKLDSQMTSYDSDLSNLNSQVSENKFENSIEELVHQVKNQKDTIEQLRTKVSKLESKIQTTNVESSTTSSVGTTPNVIKSTTQSNIESSTIEDCEDIRALGYETSGVYGVNFGNGQTKQVYCEMSADSGAWTRILHRQDSNTEFNLTWADYEHGFGDPQQSYWIGLIVMNKLTTSRKYKMRVDLMDWEGETAYAEYLEFRVGPGSDKYRLSIANYSGTAHDAMAYHDYMLFTTIDQDNDRSQSLNCAEKNGGWWYRGCFYARLTGPYLKGGRPVPKGHGIQWYGWRGVYGCDYSYKVATMKVQRL